MRSDEPTTRMEKEKPLGTLLKQKKFRGEIDEEI